MIGGMTIAVNAGVWVVEVPDVLAGADLGEAGVVDLWIEGGEWHAGNDDRSVVGTGNTHDEALNTYLFGLQAARAILA